jgi:glycerol-3-phosphate dehydrogenase subunit B
MHFDLIIIGMGLSGLMAAKRAVESGLKVLIIGKGMGSLCLFSNTIDVLGTLAPTMKMEEGLSHWIENHPQHPYSQVGLGTIKEALSSFTALFPPPYSFQSREGSNSMVLTGAGTFRPTYLIPSTMAVGGPLEPAETLIVGFRGFKDFYARYAANGLKGRGISLGLVESLEKEVTASGLARLMERPSVREHLGREIKAQKKGDTRIGVPAILGLRDPMEIKRGLEKIIEAEVFEIATLPPSIPGKRVFTRFKEWLIRNGTTWLLGHFVSSATISRRRCETIHVSNPPVQTTYSADRYILATGRFIEGGLTATRHGIIEPILGLPVYQPHSREEWFGKSFFSDHLIHQAGVLTDSRLRPVDETGNVILDNVWVAGSILAHHDSVAEKSREGIEIATGYWAAQQALEAS